MRQTLTRQPYAPPPIDWNNPLTRGLVASYYNSATDYLRPPLNYVGPIDTTATIQNVTLFTGGSSLTSSAIIPGGSPADSLTPYFTSASPSAAKTKFDLSPYSQLTISFWLWWQSFQSDDQLLLEYTSNYNANNGFLIDLNSSGGGCDFNLHLAGNYCAAKATRDTQRSAQWHHYAWLIDFSLASSQTVAIYVDGIADSFTQGGNSIPANSSFTADEYLYFMGRNMSAFFGNGSIAHFNIHNRNLSEAEVFALVMNPFQIMAAPVRSRPAIVAGGGGGPVANYRWFLAA